MKCCSRAWRHRLAALCQPVHRAGVVNIQHSSAVLFATVNGACDMSPKISLYLLCNRSLCSPAQSRAHAPVSHSAWGGKGAEADVQWERTVMPQFNHCPRVGVPSDHGNGQPFPRPEGECHRNLGQATQRPPPPPPTEALWAQEMPISHSTPSALPLPAWTTLTSPPSFLSLGRLRQRSPSTVPVSLLRVGAGWHAWCFCHIAVHRHTNSYRDG